VLSAAQGPLAEAVQARRFRADLQARLEGMTIVLPPLRERRDDAAALFVELVRQLAGGHPPPFDRKLIEAVALHDWPLNVRELVAVARQLLLLHGHEPLLTRSHLPETVRPRVPEAGEEVAGAAEAENGPRAARRKSVDDEDEFARLVEALRAHAGSVAAAAGALGLSRSRAYRLLAAHPEFSLDEIKGG
jgi:DNA-binding NtrC family response regulator